MYNLAAFASSFPYPSVEVGAVVIGIVVADIIAHKSGNSGLKSKIS